MTYRTSSSVARAQPDAPRIAVKIPGAALALEVCDGEDGAQRTIAAAIGERANRGGLNLAAAHIDGRLTYIRMVIDDDGFQKKLTPNFPYPNHPELDVPGAAVFRKWADVEDGSLPLPFSEADLVYLRMLTAETPSGGFRLPLLCAGWERQSMFGYDPPLATWFAQLTPNDASDYDGPAMWLGTRLAEYYALDALCAAIANAIVDDYAPVAATIAATLDLEMVGTGRAVRR